MLSRELAISLAEDLAQPWARRTLSVHSQRHATRRPAVIRPIRSLPNRPLDFPSMLCPIRLVMSPPVYLRQSHLAALLLHHLWMSSRRRLPFLRMMRTGDPMPTVPTYGPDDDGTGGIPRELQPTMGDLLMAAAMHVQQQQDAELQPHVPSEELQREEEAARLGAHQLATAAAASAAPSSVPHSPPMSRSPSAVRMLRARR
jgi:hypothetical protein